MNSNHRPPRGPTGCPLNRPVSYLVSCSIRCPQNRLPACSAGCSLSRCPRRSLHRSTRCSAGRSDHCGLSRSPRCPPRCPVRCSLGRLANRLPSCPPNRPVHWLSGCRHSHDADKTLQDTSQQPGPLNIAGRGLCRLRSASRRESARESLRKPACKCFRERPRNRPSESARQPVCLSTSKSRSEPHRQSVCRSLRKALSVSRPASPSKPRRESPKDSLWEPPPEPSRERFPPWFPEGRFRRARPRLTYRLMCSYVVLGPSCSAYRPFRTVPQDSAPRKPRIRASQADRRGRVS